MTTDTTRCTTTTELGLGCARTAGHTGAHWLTGRPAEARAELRRDGFFSDTPAEPATEECPLLGCEEPLSPGAYYCAEHRRPSGWDYNLTTCYRLGCTATTTPTLRYCAEHYR